MTENAISTQLDDDVAGRAADGAVQGGAVQGGAVQDGANEDGANEDRAIDEAGPRAGDLPSPEVGEVFEALHDVVDPELGINVVDLGLVYGVDLGDDGVATIDMTLTSAACPLTDVIEDQAAEALDGLVRGFRINWVWLPPWGPDKITEDGREQLRALGFNV